MRREPLSHALVDWIREEGLKGTIPPARYDDHVVVGRFSPDMLMVLACDDHELVTSISVLEKMMFDHAISAERVKGLHQLVCTPQKVFRSATHPDTSIVVLTPEELRGCPILVPVRLNHRSGAGKPLMHWVASAYAKDHPEMLAKWEQRGLLLWERGEDGAGIRNEKPQCEDAETPIV